MALHANADEDSQAKSDRIAIQCCMIAPDDACFFEHLDAAQAGRGRKADFLGQLDIGEPGIFLKCRQYLAVDGV